jgi:HlyD family secretion protein
VKKIMLLVLIAALAAGGYVTWRHQDQARKSTVPLTLFGNVDIRTVQLAFDGDALVSSMRVEEGAHVKAGDVLATLDSSRLQAELDEARAMVRAQEATVRRMEAGTRKQEVQQARARVASAQARLDNAEQNTRRLAQTAASGASSQQKLEDAQALVRVETAAVEEARQSLALAMEGYRLEDIDQTRAQLDASRARVKLLEIRLHDSELHAPTNGIIRSRLLEPGDYVTRGRAVYILALTDPKWVRAYVPEPSLGRVRHGAQASVTSDSFAGQSFDGWVGYISPVAEFTPKTVETTDLRTQLVYEVRVYLKDPSDHLRLGMPTTVVIDEQSPPAAAPGPATRTIPATTRPQG